MSSGLEPPTSGMPGKISDYRLDSYIGRGRQADVYRAHDERMGRTVAVKILASALADDAAFRDRFLRESEATGEIAHPNILPVYEVGDMGGLLYVAMRYVAGGSAGSLVGRAGPLPVARAWSIIAQVASALDAAHSRGLIHRDVKPANVLVDASQGEPGPNGNGRTDHAYLADFGMGSPSVSPGSDPQASDPGVAPDFDYVAPEQIAGRDADGRADLYSLACVGYYLLCGAAPYGQEQGMAAMRAHLNARPPTATALRPDLPAAVDIVLATALAKNPADRYPTCAEFAAALQAGLGLGASGAGGAPLLPSHGAAGPADIWPAYGAAGMAVVSSNGTGPKPTQVLGPVLVGPEGPVPPAGRPPEPSGAPGGPFPAADDAFSEPAGPYQEPAGLRPGPGGPFPAADAPFPEPAGLYREPRAHQDTDDFPPAVGLFREPAGAYPGPADPYVLPEPPRRPPSRPPGGRYPRRTGRGRRFVVGFAVAVVVAAVAAIAVVVLSRRSAPPHAAATPPNASASSASAANASAQAAAVNNLLTASASTRTSLSAAVGQVRKCMNVPAAVTQLQNVVNQRNSEVRQASALSTAAITNGATVKSDLLAALRSSLAADSDYLTWAQQESSGCKPGANTPAYNAAVGADSQAVTAKQTFVTAWDPIAATYGLPKQTVDTF